MIKKLIKLIQYEREAEISVMIEEIKKTSPQKREKLGRAINNVKGKKLNKELGFTIVQYGRKELIDTEIKVADEVLLSRGNPLKSDLTGTVTEKGSRYIKIALEHIPKWALKKHIRLDLYVSDITYKRMEENLLNLTKNGKKALSYILENHKLENIEINSKIDFYDKNLNDSQKEAVLKSLNTNDFFLIHGPFGTGKTRTIVELIKQLKGSKILVTTESNSAVDNILDRLDDVKCTRLGHPQRVSKENIKETLAYKVENHPLNNEILKIQKTLDELIAIRDQYTKPTPQWRRGFSDSQIIANGHKKQGGRGINAKTMISMCKWLESNVEIDKLEEKIKAITKKIETDIINKSDVILSTNSSAALEIIKYIEFEVAIIDEASQATIPSVLIPIAKAKKFILAGDHKQLPPTILSSKAKYLENTLFEILIEKYPEKSELLNVQYRMNEELMKFPNKEFYDGKLLSANKEKYKDSLTFIDTSNYENNQEKRLKDSKSIINKLEASIVVDLVNNLLKEGVKINDIGIITPYADQVNLIKNKVDVEVKSVDGFQGREKEIIIISTVRSNNNGNLGFLTDLRRLNVSLTRAKRKLIIVGNKNTLKTNSTYKRLITNF